MNLQDVPIPVLIQQVVHPERQKLVGRRLQAMHLQSDYGRTLNGKMVMVRGFDKETKEARLHCELLDDKNGKQVKIKATSLVVPEEYSLVNNFMKRTAHQPIDKDTLAACLSKAIQKIASGKKIDRADLMHRVEIYKRLLKKLTSGISNANADLQDKDFCFPCKAGCDLLDGPFGLIMNEAQTACAGNEMIDLHRLDIGLTGDDVTECSVCQEALKHDMNEVIVTLPCLHVFHDSCIVKWLQSDLGHQQWNCPSCRAIVPFDMSTYRIRYHEALQKRFDEYLLSGFCVKCQIMIMERGRNKPLGFENDQGLLQVGPLAVQPNSTFL